MGFITAVLEVAGGGEVWSARCQALPQRPLRVSLIFKQSHEGGILITRTEQSGEVSLRQGKLLSGGTDLKPSSSNGKVEGLHR